MRRLVVFDLDGTLVDSRRDIADSANDTLAEYGATPLSEDAIGRMVGDGAPILIARAFTAAGMEKPADALDRFLSLYDRRLLRHTVPYPGIPEVLDRLASRTLLGVLTNKPLAATERILQGLDLARYFQPARVIGGDGRFPRKPDPAGLRHLIRLSEAAPEAAVLVGDSVNDWKTARNAGAQLCLARYGFGCEGFPIDQLGAGDRVVDTPLQLLDVL